MATIKLTIDKRRTYQDARHPLILRLTSKGKSTSIDTNVKVLLSEWDSRTSKVNKTHTNWTNVNFFLQKQVLDLEKKLLDYSLKGEELPVQQLKQVLIKGVSVLEVKFRDFAQLEIKALRDQERFGNAQCYETAVNRFIRFAGSEILLRKT